MLPDKQKKRDIRLVEALGYVSEVFAIIVIPTVALGLAGTEIDQRWHTSPYGTVIGLILSLVVCGVLINRKAHEIASRLNQS